MLPHRRIAHARGYLELGMWAEAAAELQKIPLPDCDTTEVLALRVAVHQERENWPELQQAGRLLAQLEPDQPAGWIAWAYATRRTESLHAAEQILLAAAERHPGEATIHFNLGCYACQRGDLAQARRRVDRAIALDRKFTALAATDPDLAPLRAAERSDCPPSG